MAIRRDTIQQATTLRGMATTLRGMATTVGPATPMAAMVGADLA